MYANAMTAPAATPGRHRRARVADGRPAVHAGQHHDHRQPARPRDQRQRLLPGQRRSNRRSYTRNGQFKVDRDGFIVNDQGSKLMGYPADAPGTIMPGAAGPLQLPTGGIDPAATTTITMEINLDARAGRDAARRRRRRSTSPTRRPTTTRPRVTVFDAKGQDVALTYYFQKAATDTWNVYATANGTPIGDRRRQPGAVDDDHLPGQRRHADRAGRPGRDRHPVVDQRRRRGHAADHRHRARRLRRDAVRLAASASPTWRRTATPPGQLIGVQVENNGNVMARYSNGQTQARRARSRWRRFRNPQGLQPLGGNAWGADLRLGRPARRRRPATATSASLQAGRARGIERRPDRPSWST